MKDEYQVRVEAIKLSFMVGGLAPSARLKYAHDFEQYILNGYSGEAPAAPQALSVVPATGAKEPSVKRTKRASAAPAEVGEASEAQEQGDQDGPIGRPSSKAAGIGV